MSPKVLRDTGLTREIQPLEVATLEGFDIVLSPSATLVPSTKGVVYGVIADLTQVELNLLYARDWLKDYKPRSVTVKTSSQQEVAATCYIAPPNPNVPSKPDYVARLIDIAKAYGFPSWYVERVRNAGQA
jgi:cation transport regulator ChaC